MREAGPSEDILLMTDEEPGIKKNLQFSTFFVGEANFFPTVFLFSVCPLYNSHRTLHFWHSGHQTCGFPPPTAQAAGCPTIQLNSDTIYLDCVKGTGSDPQDGLLIPTSNAHLKAPVITCASDHQTTSGVFQ